MSKTPLSERIRPGMGSLRAHFRAGREVGFSLIELVVTVAIIVVKAIGMEDRQMFEAGSPVEESSEHEPVALAVSGR